MSGTAGWVVEELRGDAEALHHRPHGESARRTVTVASVDRPALVLGSAQRDDVVDWHAAEADCLQVTRRQSGGGAVLLEPGGSTWIDVVIPRDDPLWSDDVGVAFHWLGEVWAKALDSFLAPQDLVVHRGALVANEWSALVCFAGTGPGEVTLSARGASAFGPKVVGMSQRRTRDAARFQCIVHHRWNPARLLTALALTADERRAAATALSHVTAEVDAASASIVAGLLANLPA